MNKIKVCSLFSGIGGFETGLLNAWGKDDFEVIFASEIDKFASLGYEKLYRNKPYGDITKIEAKDIPVHDLLIAGFPCQSFSLAGKRLGFSDLTRGTLFFEVARIAEEKQPKVLFLENVKGLLSDDNGNTIKTIVSVLSEIGYHVDFELLNSKFFNVGQNRERVYIIAIKDIEQESWILQSESNTINKIKKEIMNLEGIRTFNFDFPKNNIITKRIKDILEEEVDDKYYMKEEVSQRLIEMINSALQQEAIMENDIHKILDIPKNIVNDNERQRRLYSIEGISPTVLARPDTPKILLLGYLDMKAGKQIRSVYHPEGLSPTIDTAQGGHRQVKIYLDYEFKIRKLTPLECFRLQNLPDTYYEKLREMNMSDTQLYKMAGNAVTTSVIESVAHKIRKYL